MWISGSGSGGLAAQLPQDCHYMGFRLDSVEDSAAIMVRDLPRGFKVKTRPTNITFLDSHDFFFTKNHKYTKSEAGRMIQRMKRRTKEPYDHHSFVE